MRSVEYRIQITRLNGRRAIYGTFNSVDLAAVGTALTIQLANLVRQLRRGRRQLRRGRFRRTERAHGQKRLPPLELIPEEEDGSPESESIRRVNKAIATLNEATDPRNPGVKGRDRLVRRAKKEATRRDRSAHRQMLALVSRPMIAFSTVKLVAFAVTAAVLSKLVSIPFSSLGWIGVVCSAAVAYIAVHFGLAPILSHRLEPILRAEVARLARGVRLVCAHLAVNDVALERKRDAAARAGARLAGDS